MGLPDFTGYVTKYGIKCTDGRIIQAHAFKHNDGAQIPLVWQHQHNDPANVLGHLILRHVNDGVRAEGYFNDSDTGKQAKLLVLHKDIKALSIYANGLIENNRVVKHGNIREGSLVMSGANPGAFIDNVSIQHGDGDVQVLDDEAIIFFDDPLVLEHAYPSTTVEPPRQIAMPNPTPLPPSSSNGNTPADNSEPSVEDVLNTLNDDQKNVVFALIGAAMGQSGIDDSTTSTTTEPDKKGDEPVTRNVFDQTGDNDQKAVGATLSHSDIKGIFDAAHKGGSLKGAVEEYALAHNIDNIGTLFPYDQNVTDTPEFISRRMDWVAAVLSKTRKTPFSRIRSWTADITFQEARAKGFIKGSLKKEEFIRIARRITTPQTIYKKQKLDRDDILDITEFDVVTWLQTEMRLLLDEELARAILIGDGRDVDDPDKISTSNVRPIYGDDGMYVTKVNVSATAIAVANTGPDAIVDGVVNAFRFYKGSGNPCMYTTRIWLAKMLLIKDTLGRRLYPTTVELSAALGVSDVIACESLEDIPDLIGIVVNLTDYTVGADKGGQVSMFDFFDIDYNQFKYLMETRVSGAMTKYRGAFTVSRFSGVGGMLPDPAAPTFNNASGVGTIPAFSGLHLTYVTVAADGTVSGALTVGAQAPISSGGYVTYRAVPDATYEFSTDFFEWTFRRD